MGARHCWVCILTLAATTYMILGQRNVHIATYCGEHCLYINSLNPHNDPKERMKLKNVEAIYIYGK